MKIGIIGYGVIGIALDEWLKENNHNVETCISDPPKGINNDICDCDAYFIQNCHAPIGMLLKPMKILNSISEMMTAINSILCFLKIS